MGFNPANVIILRISAIFRIFAVLFATACVSCKCLPFPGIFLCGKLFASAGNVLNSLPNPRKHEGTPNPLKGALPLAQRGLTLLPKGVLPFCPKGSYPFAQRGLTLLPKRGLTLLPKRGLTLLPKGVTPQPPKGGFVFCLKGWKPLDTKGILLSLIASGGGIGGRGFRMRRRAGIIAPII